MSQSEVTEAILNILKKEVGALEKLLPSDILKSLEEKINPEVNRIIEGSGYIKKTKYEALKNNIDKLEKRIIDLEKEL
jgi:polyhydroxyalkanoate synthesis regulator phasin|tara:strand:- start:79 stop:312 length:234 start_codon:yes stop_codon:yes gene_type:complete